jgi:hypothetical protein
MASLYTHQTEQERRAFIESILAKAKPLIAVVCREGVLFATVNRIAGLQKVRVIHPAGLFLGGIGDVDAIELMAETLTTVAVDLWLEAGRSAVTAIDVLREAQRMPDGGLWVFRRIFGDRNVRPLVGQFVLADLTGKGKPMLHFLSSTGERGPMDGRLIVLKKSGEAMAESLREAFGERLPTVADASAVIRRVWQEHEEDPSPEFSLARAGNPATLSPWRHSR